VWFGIGQLAFSFGTAVAAGGLTEVALTTFVTGVVTILLRAVTTTPLAEK
jgi:hypothetical protein